MQHNFQVASAVFHIAPGFVDCGHLAILVSEADIAHGQGRVAIQVNDRIFGFNTSPALQCKARIIGEFFVTAYKIGQCPFFSATA
jgi:hypothetical protein